MFRILRWLLLYVFPGFTAWGTDTVWDPTEIARLGQQAAQISLQYSTLVNLQQTMDGLAGGVGPAGVRESDANIGMASLIPLQALAPAGAVPDSAGLLKRLPSAGHSASQNIENRLYWGRAAKAAALDALAAGISLQQGLALQTSQVQSAAAQAGSAADLRGDLAANSTICLILFADLALVEATLALSLQQQSTAVLWQMAQ